MSKRRDEAFPGLLALRRGHSPNCSSAGSVVGVALVTAAAAAVVLNAWAWWFLGELRGPGGPEGGEPGDPTLDDTTTADPAPGTLDAAPPASLPPRLRQEAFGGILAARGALLFLDPERAAQAAEHALPHGEAAPPAPEGALRAPTEVHLAVTERCPARCTGCYLSAGPEVQHTDPTRSGLLADLEALAGQGVFEVAFGGGEAALREDLFELAAHARSLGMVPNLTTSGFGLTHARAARAAALFGQVNVSIDGLGPVYEAARGWDGAARGFAALGLLREAGARVGVNTVLSRPLLETPGALEALAIEITEKGAQEWQWLRFKPTGRGLEAWEALAPSPEQLDGIWARALEIERQTGLQLRFDCALVPFLVGAGLPPERLARM
ncbi:MAG: radical SAM protein, partial [Alphaproteobacteria bacterium]|nr:radical SAM protein [Alphaproteobacteria bacterium]